MGQNYCLYRVCCKSTWLICYSCCCNTRWNLNQVITISYNPSPGIPAFQYVRKRDTDPRICESHSCEMKQSHCLFGRYRLLRHPPLLADPSQIRHSRPDCFAWMTKVWLIRLNLSKYLVTLCPCGYIYPFKNLYLEIWLLETQHWQYFCMSKHQTGCFCRNWYYYREINIITYCKLARVGAVKNNFNFDLGFQYRDKPSARLI